MKQTIIFTGGHHNSALEIAKNLKKEGFNIVWVGHKYSTRGDKNYSAEYKEVSENNIKFLDLKAGKFYKRLNPFGVIKIMFGFFQSLLYLISEKPALIFSSGGYLAVPVVISGWVLGIPSVTHEQTVVAGWANKAISPFVKKILLSHESSKKNYPPEKSEVVGLPVRKYLLSKKYTKKYSPKLIYITCGKQGSHTINEAVFPIIPELVKKYTVIHQTGSNSLTKDTEKARRTKAKLGEYKNRYLHSPYFFAKEASSYLRSASLIISRAGAHTCYELMLLHKKAVLIPIPWVSHDEQFLNAKMVSKYNTVRILEEKNLSSENLLESISGISREKAKKSSIKLVTNATEKIIGIIHQYLKS